MVGYLGSFMVPWLYFINLANKCKHLLHLSDSINCKRSLIIGFHYFRFLSVQNCTSAITKEKGNISDCLEREKTLSEPGLDFVKITVLSIIIVLTFLGNIAIIIAIAVKGSKLTRHCLTFFHKLEEPMRQVHKLIFVYRFFLHFMPISIWNG